jgi:hypothetical protein
VLVYGGEDTRFGESLSLGGDILAFKQQTVGSASI